MYGPVWGLAHRTFFRKEEHNEENEVPARGGDCNRRMNAGTVGAADTAASLKAAITVWAWPSADKAFESIIAGFNQKYPGIQVTWEIKPGMAAGTRDALLAALAAGTGGPDVVLIEINDIGMYALHGGFVDLRKAPYNARHV